MPQAAQQQQTQQQGPGSRAAEQGPNNPAVDTLASSSYANGQSMVRPRARSPWELLTPAQVQSAVRYNRTRPYTTAQVRAIQNRINVPDDGAFGPITVKALAKWQMEHDLTPDGKAGPRTWTAIREAGPAPADEQQEENGRPEDPAAHEPVPGGLTANFQASEFACKDGTAVPRRYFPHLQRLARNLEALREAFGGAAIHVNSGYRTPSYNARVGGAGNSMHLYAKAADITVAGKTPRQVKAKIDQLIASGRMEDGGVGQYSTFVHYDVRGYRARW